MTFFGFVGDMNAWDFAMHAEVLSLFARRKFCDRANKTPKRFFWTKIDWGKMHYLKSYFPTKQTSIRYTVCIGHFNNIVIGLIVASLSIYRTV